MPETKINTVQKFLAGSNTTGNTSLRMTAMPASIMMKERKARERRGMLKG